MWHQTTDNKNNNSHFSVFGCSLSPWWERSVLLSCEIKHRYHIYSCSSNLFISNPQLVYMYKYVYILFHIHSFFFCIFDSIHSPSELCMSDCVNVECFLPQLLAVWISLLCNKGMSYLKTIERHIFTWGWLVWKCLASRRGQTAVNPLGPTPHSHAERLTGCPKRDSGGTTDRVQRRLCGLQADRHIRWFPLTSPAMGVGSLLIFLTRPGLMTLSSLCGGGEQERFIECWNFYVRYRGFSH